MKYILLLIVIPTLLCSQEWNDSYWEKVPIYKNGQEIDFNDYRIADAKCFGDECIMVLNNSYLFTEIFKTTDGGDTWNSIYDTSFDIETGEFPDWFVPYNPRLTEIQSLEKVIFTYDDDNGILNKFDLNTFENDTSFKLETIHEIKNLSTNFNGYGIAAHGVTYFLTKDHWETADLHTTNSISELLVTEENEFFNINIEQSDTSSILSKSLNGVDWEEYRIGNGVIQEIYKFSDSLFWVGGIKVFEDLKKRRDIIYNSTNGGQTWNLQLEDSSSIGWSVRDIFFINKELGIALTGIDYYYTTTNGGLNWIKQKRKFVKNKFEINKSFITDKYLFQYIGLGGLYKYELSLLSITSVPLNEYKTINTYPSPFVNRFTLDAIDVPSGNYSLKIHSINGDLVLDNTINIPSQIEIEANLPSGSYFLILENEKNHFFQKIIKE